MFLDLLNKQNTTPLTPTSVLHGVQFDKYHGRNEPNCRCVCLEAMVEMQRKARATRKRGQGKGNEAHRAYPEVNWSEWKCETTHNLYLLLDIVYYVRTSANKYQTAHHHHRPCEIPFWLHKICTIWWMFTCHGIAVAWRYITYTYFVPHPTNTDTTIVRIHSFDRR